MTGSRWVTMPRGSCSADARGAPCLNPSPYDPLPHPPPSPALCLAPLRLPRACPDPPRSHNPLGEVYRECREKGLPGNTVSLLSYFRPFRYICHSNPISAQARWNSTSRMCVECCGVLKSVTWEFRMTISARMRCFLMSFIIVSHTTTQGEILSLHYNWGWA